MPPYYTLETRATGTPDFDSLLIQRGIERLPVFPCAGDTRLHELRKARAREAASATRLHAVAARCAERAKRIAFGEYAVGVIQEICRLHEDARHHQLSWEWHSCRRDFIADCIQDAVKGYEDRDCPEVDAWCDLRELCEALDHRAAAIDALTLAEAAVLKSATAAA